MSPLLVKRLFAVFDKDGSGSVDQQEFLAGVAACCSGSKEEKMALAFVRPSARLARATANCIIIDHFSVFEFELVAPFLTLPLKNGWQWVKTARSLNIGVSRNRFCDFLAEPDNRSFSRFGAIIMQ